MRLTGGGVPLGLASVGGLRADVAASCRKCGFIDHL